MTSRFRLYFFILLLATGLCSSLQAQSPEPPTDAALQATTETPVGAEVPMAGDSDLGGLGQTAEIEWLRAAEPDTVVCPFRGRIDYEPGEIECGLIRVPENRERPDSRTIELNYVRIVATGKNHEDEEVDTRDDPVIYLTGGPGVTVDVYVDRFKDHRLIASETSTFSNSAASGTRAISVRFSAAAMLPTPFTPIVSRAIAPHSISSRPVFAAPLRLASMSPATTPSRTRAMSRR